MKHLTRLLFMLIPFCAQAQFYIDASDNLPSNGAKGASMDVRAADLDGDGDLDIVLANEFQSNVYLLNDGNAVFTNVTSGDMTSLSKDSEDVAISDFNGDGLLDIVFSSEDNIVLGQTNVHEYYFGDGAGNFVFSTFILPDSEANAVMTADLNGDGMPDLLFGNNGGTGVLINDGNADGTFTEENERVPQVSLITQDLALADVNGDEHLDLFEGNENGNLLHINDGTGHFTDETDDRLPDGLNIETRKVSFGDVEGDGDLDVFLSNVEFIPGKNRQNRLFLNDGTGHFTDATAAQLPTDNDHTIDAIFEDVDLDGDLDIVVANVFGAPIKIYGNDGAGIFSNITQDVLGQNYIRDALGVIAEDFNGDGFRDLYICDRFQAANNRKDLLLLREPVSTVGETIGAKQDVLIYPNPARSYFYIKTKVEMPDTIRLVEGGGKIMASLIPQPQGDETYRFDVSKNKLLAGMYYLEIAGERKSIYLAP